MTCLKLTLENLAFERHYQPLFSEINATLKQGESLQIKGANGSGKSTLLRLLAGFIEPSLGKILWQNKSIFLQRDFYPTQLHYLGHQTGIKEYLTVGENLQLACALTSAKISSSQLNQSLATVDLAHLIDSKALHLSAGQLRRLSLARLLLKQAPLWILDEPTTALDDQGQNLFAQLLQKHLTFGGMAVIATHQLIPLIQNNQIIRLGKQHV